MQSAANLFSIESPFSSPLSMPVRSLICVVTSLIVFSVGSSAAAADQDSWSKLDTRLRFQYLGRVFSGDQDQVSLFLKSSSPESTRLAVEEVGGAVGTVAGDILTARVPRYMLPILASRREVAELEGAVPVRYRMDRVRAAIGADQVNSGAAPLTSGISGEGVLVGVVDFGLDLTHPAFQDAAGSAVVGLWDQDDEGGAPPPGWSYGTLCTEGDLNDGTCTHTSEEDHGTHVTGIAAGRPVAGVPYQGIAPDAKIAFVNLGSAAGVEDEDQAFTTAVCDGVAWIFSVAEELGMPAAVNLSIGSHEGPHDGTSLASQCLDNLTGPGRIILAAAGNEGAGGYQEWMGEDVFLHMQGDAGAEAQIVTFLPNWDTSESGYPYCFGYVWFDSNTDISVRLGFQDENEDYADSDPVSIDGYFEGTLSTGSLEVGSVYLEGWESEAGPRVISFIVSDDDQDGAELSQLWYLEITGSGRFDGFIDTTESAGFSLGGDESVAVNNSMSIGYPAVGAKVLAVGSFVTRNEWDSVDGSAYIQEDGATGEQVVVGALSSFSSRGPSRNEALTGVKPDITAPGEIIASALNSGTANDELEYLTVLGAPGTQGSYLVMEGTSMASPVMTGVVALMLQVAPELTVDQIRTILDQTADEDEFVAALTRYDWGRGKVNALSAIQAMLQSPTNPDDDSPGDVTADLPDDTDQVETEDTGCSAASTGRGSALLLLALVLGLLFRFRSATPHLMSMFVILTLALPSCATARGSDGPDYLIIALAPDAELKPGLEQRMVHKGKGGGQVILAMASSGQTGVEFLARLGGEAELKKVKNLRSYLRALESNSEAPSYLKIDASTAPGDLRGTLLNLGFAVETESGDVLSGRPTTRDLGPLLSQPWVLALQFAGKVGSRPGR